MPIVSLVDLDNNINEIEVEDGSILLDALQDQGVELPHGCLAGSCGACKIEILEGSENLSKLSYIEADTIESVKSYANNKHGDDFCSGKELRLACRTKVVGATKIKPFKV